VLNFEENDMTLNDLTVEITYEDDEMDNICFSSDEELVDALLQFSKLKHTSNISVVLCCKAVMQNRKLKGPE
jgi:sulfite reductase alpha subunit-like flavoprotein